MTGDSIVFWALLVAATAPNVSSANDLQFNLTCTGVTKDYNFAHGPDTKPTIVPWNGSLRLDLSSGQFCYDEDCQIPVAIENIGAERIRLRDLEDGAVSDKAWLDRASGVFNREYIVSGGSNRSKNVTRLYEATCIKAPFTGLPSNKF